MAYVSIISRVFYVRYQYLAMIPSDDQREKLILSVDSLNLTRQIQIQANVAPEVQAGAQGLGRDDAATARCETE